MGDAYGFLRMQLAQALRKATPEIAHMKLEYIADHLDELLEERRQRMEDAIYWIQILASDGQWVDHSGHRALQSAKNVMSHARETTSNEYRMVKRVTTIVEEAS